MQIFMQIKIWKLYLSFQLRIWFLMDPTFDETVKVLLPCSVKSTRMSRFVNVVRRCKICLNI